MGWSPRPQHEPEGEHSSRRVCDIERPHLIEKRADRIRDENDDDESPRTTSSDANGERCEDECSQVRSSQDAEGGKGRARERTLLDLG